MRLSRLTAVTAAGVAIVIVMAACSSSKEPSGGGTTGGSSTGSGGTTSAASPPPSGLPDPAQQPKSKVQAASLTGDCAPFSKYGKYSGATVTMYASITNPEGASLEKSWKKFEQCTGITIQYTGDKEFETALKAKVEGGNAPDIAIIPQPGLVQTFATSGKLKPASDAVTREAEGNWNKDWIGYATVDDLYFGSPMSGNAKSLVWYSPKYFQQYGYTVPTTWDDMVTLSDKMAADGHKPWCAGIESGTATGWPATDWLEEVVLRKYGPDVYDQWIAHEIPFNDPKILDSLKTVGSI